MDWTFVLLNGLLFGGLITVVMTAMIVISLRVNAEIWSGDTPPEIKAVLPPISATGRKQRALFAYPTFAILILLSVWAVARVYQNGGGFPGFWVVAATVWIAFQTFNLVDLLLIDWLLVETIRPGFVVIPGAEAFKERRFYGYHLLAFLKGFLGITVMSLATAGVLAGVDFLV